MKFTFDMHTHTYASGHAYSTMQEMITEAKRKGLTMLGISDHSPGMPGSAHIYHFHNLRVVPRELEGLKLMLGVEANIIDYDGTIDMSMEDLAELDYVIASLHAPTLRFGSAEENTRAIISAMSHPRINIIGHPDDSRFPLNYEPIVEAAAENKVLLEINNTSLSPKAFRKDARSNIKKLLELCKAASHPIILGSDAHYSADIANYSFCVELLKEMDFPEDLVMNTSNEKLLQYFDLKRTRG